MTDKIDAIEEMLAAQEQAELTEGNGTPFAARDIPVLIIFAVLFGTVFLQFFTRYVLNDSLSWTEEAARYLLILLTFVGAINCQILDSHIRLEFIDQLFEKQVGKLKTIALLLSAFYFGFLAYALSILATQTSFQKMVSLPFPKYYLYILIMIALVILVIVHVVQLIRMLKG